MSLRLSERQPAWFWHVTVSNLGTDPVEVDLVHTQDVALAPLARSGRMSTTSASTST